MPCRSPSWRCVQPWPRRRFALPAPRAASPCDPRAARTLRRPRAPLLPCPCWLGRDGSWAPCALLRRRLGRRSGCGGRSGCGEPSPPAGAGAAARPGLGAPCFVSGGRAAVLPLIAGPPSLTHELAPRDPARPSSEGLGVACLDQSRWTVSAERRAQAEVNLRWGREPRPLGSRLAVHGCRPISALLKHFLACGQVLSALLSTVNAALLNFVRARA